MKNKVFRQKTMYRIVLTCWDRGEEKPYTDCVTSLFNSEEEARSVIRACVKDELEALNERELTDSEVEYPTEDDAFKADFDGDNDAIIRFWDGEDYWCVTAYNIHKIVPCGKKSWCYRNEDSHSYYIYESKTGKRFAVELGDDWLSIKHSLQSALEFIDNAVLERQIAKGGVCLCR